MSILHSLLRASLIILLLLVKEGCIDAAYLMRQVLSNNLSLSASSLTLQEYIHSPILYPSLAPPYRHPFKTSDESSLHYCPFLHTKQSYAIQTLILSSMTRDSDSKPVYSLTINWIYFSIPDSFDSFSVARALSFRPRLL